MEKYLHTPETRPPLIEPPSEAKLSTILNGMGNGAMLGGLPFLLLNLYESIVTKPKNAVVEHALRNKIGLGLTVLGCTVGGYLGVKEAERLRGYRDAMSNEMADLRAEVNSIKQRPADWSAKEDQRAAVLDTDPIAR